MTYATLPQMIERFGETTLAHLTDRGETATGEVVVSVVERALADSDAIINGYVGNRYALPLASVPELLVDLALIIAIYKLHVFQSDQKIKDDYDAAIRTLRDISSGVVKLDVAGIGEPASSGASGVEYIDRERPLTPESLRGFI